MSWVNQITDSDGNKTSVTRRDKISFLLMFWYNFSELWDIVYIQYHIIFLRELNPAVSKENLNFF